MRARVLQFGGAEAEHLVPAELELAVGACQGDVTGGGWPCAVGGCVVVGSVDFEDDPLVVGQQVKEVHAVAQQGSRAALADGLGVPVQPYLGQQRGEAGYCGAVDLVVEVEQVPLGRGVAGKGAGEPLVQRPLGLLIAAGRIVDFPLFPQVAPPEAVTADGPVVDEDLIGVLICSAIPLVRVRGSLPEDLRGMLEQRPVGA